MDKEIETIKMGRVQSSELHENIQKGELVMSPELMKQYGDIDSGFPERIMSMTEKERLHKQQLESEQLEIKKLNAESLVNARKSASIFTIIVCLTLVGASISFIIIGRVSAGILFAVLGAIGPIVNTYYSYYSVKKVKD
ncbi:DUF2335 domain-containing protein [Halosquirtibacter xylanolyticus]|uniref:DUF2335 domain-containing protein n=1 Tax=Halosquirtibacter xylanolyticus TaxID=3374599 RepID=UPI00374A4B94|nr:DUF2335 domain-containing protein [Prolixibacteraceae bacterium]